MKCNHLVLHIHIYLSAQMFVHWGWVQRGSLAPSSAWQRFNSPHTRMWCVAPPPPAWCKAGSWDVERAFVCTLSIHQVSADLRRGLRVPPSGHAPLRPLVMVGTQDSCARMPGRLDTACNAFALQLHA